MIVNQKFDFRTYSFRPHMANNTINTDVGYCRFSSFPVPTAVAGQDDWGIVQQSKGLIPSCHCV